MRLKYTWLLLFFTCFVYSQQNDSIQQFSHFISPDILVGKTQPSNSGFPEAKLQKSLFVDFGKYHNRKLDEWAYRLKYARTGVSIGVTDYGNPEYIGYSVSAIPFIEFDFLRKKKKDLKMNIGIGTTYFTRKYDSVPYIFNDILENTNRSVSTRLTWTFRLFLHYEFLKKSKTNWRIGVGLYHHSNGHTSLPNHGMNAFLFSLSSQTNYTRKKLKPIVDTIAKPIYKKSKQDYLSIRFGAGQNSFTEEINSKKGVYSVDLSYGKIINKTFKFGVGAYYRFYEHFYDYIKNDGELVLEEYPHFQDKPFSYASSLGVFLTSELLMGHIGLEVEVGYTIYKPFYEVEYQLEQGFYWNINPPSGPETIFILAEFDETYKIKKAISGRVGLKYYLITNEKSPTNNLYLGIHIISKYGQADFTELSLGYVYRFKLKEKKK